MKTNALAGIAVVALTMAGIAASAAPVVAAPVGSTLTGVSIAPGTVESGEPVTITYTGTGSAPFLWVGAYNRVMTGPTGQVLLDLCFNDLSFPESLVDNDANYQAEAITTTEQFFAGTCVDSNTPPGGQTPTYEAGFTVLPMVQTTDIATTEGVALAATDSATIHGQFHPNPWVPSGGFYQAVESSNCSLSIVNIAPTSFPPPPTPIALPAGLALDSTPTASGVEPMLSVSGTPATGSAGTYRICVELVESRPVDHAFGYLNIEIAAPPVPQLAKTGASPVASLYAGLGSLAAVVLGVGALLLARRRRAAPAA